MSVTKTQVGKKKKIKIRRQQLLEYKVEKL